jgi:hypothetical protein
MRVLRGVWVLLCSSPVPAAAQTDQLVYIACSTIDASGRAFYFGAVFQGEQSRITDYLGEFTAMLKTKYNYRLGGGCQFDQHSPAGFQNLSEFVQRYAESYREKGWTVINTDWTPNGIPPATVPQKPPWLGVYLTPAIYGKVYDSLTGKPIPRLPIEFEGQRGMSFSDSLGWYLKFDAPVGQQVLAFRCPTKRRWWGRVFARRPVNIVPGTDDVVDWYVPLVGCDEPPEATREVEAAGHYQYGFEASDFTPCTALSVPDLAGTAYEGAWGGVWVEWDPKVEAPAQQWPKPSEEEPWPTVFVRWQGRLTGPGSYGHLGVGLYRLTVTKVLEVRRPGSRDCE